MVKENILRVWLIISQSNPQEYSAYLKNIFSIFERKNNINIQEEYVTWERVLTALIDAFKKNTAPDVIMIGTSWLRTFAHMGYLDQVPDWVDFKPSINEKINEICKYNESYCAVPWIVDTIIMAGRKDYMSKLDISRDDVKDWRGLNETVKRITELRKKDPNLPRPISLAFKRENDTIQRFFSLLWSQGWDFPDLRGVPEKIINDPFVIDQLKYFANLKIINESSEAKIKVHPYEVNEEFYEYGESVFYIGSWYAIVNRINEAEWEGKSEKPVANYCILPFPASSGERSVSYGGGTTLAVPASSSKKETAWKLVEHLINDEIIRKFDIGNVPAFDGAFWQKRYEDERVKLMYEQTLNSKVFPVHPAWISIENQIINAVGSILLNLVTKRSAELEEKDYSLLKNTDQNIKKILKMSWEMK